METRVPLFREKRQFGRIRILEPTICRVHLPLSRKLRGYRGLIQNISLGGIYCICDDELPIKKGDIRNFLFDIVYKCQKIYRLKFHALVVRTENVRRDHSQFAAALKFISDPVYYPLYVIQRKEVRFDKIRLLFQHYHLFKKAYEIIKRPINKQSVNIRNIKRRIDNGLYKIESIKLAQIIVDELL